MVNSPMNVDTGVRKRSNLGPLLFMIFINDLPLRLPPNDISIHADDTSVIIHADIVVEIQVNRKDILQYFKDWRWKNSIIMSAHKTSLSKLPLNSTNLP